MDMAVFAPPSTSIIRRWRLSSSRMPHVWHRAIFLIVKHSEKGLLGFLAIAPLLEETGFFHGVLQVLSGDGQTGAMLAKQMGIRKFAVSSTWKVEKVTSMSQNWDQAGEEGVILDPLLIDFQLHTGETQSFT
ncbi:hypothetical protein B0J13DRAFT_524880 [Dactylonectria estremocensis]|uniref:Uncharacterized protein n=1 Tax=Dactylonectria estremocensis TaxID=1079267 RepID=A0A9P9EYZ2_9HYPO|nr:hypothetical protein B0J13DRAFT_524880 [Dactylonectria estremocensis]